MGQRQGIDFQMASSTMTARSGQDDLVVMGHGEGEDLKSAVRAALTWARLHRTALLRLFFPSPDLDGEKLLGMAKVDLTRLDIKVLVDMARADTKKTGASVSEQARRSSC